MINNKREKWQNINWQKLVEFQKLSTAQWIQKDRIDILFVKLKK